MAPPDATILTDQHENALQRPEMCQRAVELAYPAVHVRCERKGELVLLGERLMRREIVMVDRNDLYTKIFEHGEIVAVVAELSGADERVIPGVEDQQDRAIAQELGQVDRASVEGKVKLGAGSPTSGIRVMSNRIGLSPVSLERGRPHADRRRLSGIAREASVVRKEMHRSARGTTSPLGRGRRPFHTKSPSDRASAPS